MKVALAAGARVNATTPEFPDPALYMAVTNDRREAIQFLMDRGALPSVKGKGGDVWSVVKSEEARGILSRARRWAGDPDGP